MANSTPVKFPSGGDVLAMLEVSDGYKWDTGNLTYSFPTRANLYDYDHPNSENESDTFAEFTTELKAAAREAFSIFSPYANLTFTETRETSTRHADIRLGMTDFNGEALGRGWG